jgi:tetratricopeptide (TPR) repeat protein
VGPGTPLGDFRLIREVGRGGMGVVYEAEQLSLGRRVALKVLPFAATMDSRHLQRFHNEARAAAGLHHEHIVPVYAVGQERAVHFYAMQFIDGQTLAEFIAQPKGAAPADTGNLSHAASEPSVPPPAPAAETAPARAAATAPGPRSPADYRAVAKWMAQAAEALEHAHAMGIVHRDIKPGNLMLDAQGKLWVTDFGLARWSADGSLTLTGDLVGTLRYMSPEQALAKHGLVDHRTDVYSLGATLYELLALRPAIDGRDREEILRHIAFAEPRPLRARDHSIPVDLETITQKAMAKEPAERYATAQELADDLRRWLEDRPIEARRPTLAQRAAKWCKRHLTAIWAVGIVLLLAVAGLTTGGLLLAAAYQEEAEQRHLAEAARLRADQAREAEARERKRADEGWAEATKQLARAKANLHDAFALASETELFSGKKPADMGTATLHKMIAVLDKAVAEEPEILDHRRQLFMRLHELSDRQAEEGVFAEAAETTRLTVAVLDGCLKDFPNDAEVKLVYPYHLTDYLERLGDLLRDTGGLEEGEKVYGRALDLAQQQLKRVPSPHAFWQVVSLWNGLGTLRLQAGRLPAARQSYEKALALIDPKLPDTIARSPGASAHLLVERSRCRVGLGNVLFESGKAEESIREFAAAREDYEAMMKPNSGVPNPNRRYAWFLLTCPVRGLRDPQRALGFARSELNVLGGRKALPCDALASLAAFRMSDWNASVKYKRNADCFADNGCWFVVAIAHWQLGDQKEARSSYEIGIEWMEKNQSTNLDVRRLRAEAEALLGVGQKQE